MREKKHDSHDAMLKSGHCQGQDCSPVAILQSNLLLVLYNPLLKIFFIIYINVWMSAWVICTTCVCLMPMETRRGHSNSLELDSSELSDERTGNPSQLFHKSSKCCQHKDNSPAQTLYTLQESWDKCLFWVHAKKDFYLENLEFPLSLAVLCNPDFRKGHTVTGCQPLYSCWEVIGAFW